MNKYFNLIAPILLVLSGVYNLYKSRNSSDYNPDNNQRTVGWALIVLGSILGILYL